MKPSLTQSASAKAIAYRAARVFGLSLLLSSAFAVPACGGSAAGPAAPPSPSPSASPSPVTEPAPAASGDTTSAPDNAAKDAAKDAAAPTVWSESLSKEQKAAFMKQTVMPRMSKVFQAADPARYADFSCKTCHGPAFKDPDDFLPGLTLKDGNLTAFAEKPPVAKFMAEKVVPEMASIFGQQPYDPKTHQGFGCAGCHSIAMK